MKRIIIAAAIALAACGDNLEPEPVPTCADLGCIFAFCTSAGECVCTPPGETDQMECTAHHEETP